MVGSSVMLNASLQLKTIINMISGMKKDTADVSIHIRLYVFMFTFRPSVCVCLGI